MGDDGRVVTPSLVQAAQLPLAEVDECHHEADDDDQQRDRVMAMAIDGLRAR